MKLLALVVIYKMQPSRSPTLRTLLRSKDLLREIEASLDILIWDNTPNGQHPADLTPGIRYASAPHNPGLSPAYNQALTIARDEGFDWLLTLDQDTVLPDNFLDEIARIAERLTDDIRVAAILPRVIGGKKRLSPFRFALGGIPRALPEGFTGVSLHTTYAVNSAATLRVASLQQIDGYNPLFPLDISDIDLFHRMALANMSVYVAGDLVVSHDFSLLNKRGRMSLERYRNLLRDECAFWDMNMSGFGRTERMIRLAGRVCKDLFRPGSFEFQRITFGEIIHRLLTRRSTRIKEWQSWADARRSLTAALSTSSELPLSSIDDRCRGEAF